MTPATDTAPAEERDPAPRAALLATKLFVPPARADLVPRPRLFDRLGRGLRGKLTVIAAPAGFGKTTLLGAWRAAAGPDAPPFAWVGLPPLDGHWMIGPQLEEVSDAPYPPTVPTGVPGRGGAPRAE